jgi:hypothetical protein
MIKMINAGTRELYRVDAAVRDVLGQLDIGHGLLKNSVGIISCPVEFIETGVVKALCTELPFDVAGISTRGNAVGGQCGFDLLCLSVLTSDEITFSTVLSKPLAADDLEAPVRDAFARAAVSGKQPSGKPSFILAYPPLIMDMGAQVIFEQIYTCADGVPVFGSLSCDDTVQFTSCSTIFNGEAVAGAMALIFMYGNVRARFFTASLPPKSLIREYGAVTESGSGIVKKVDDMLFSDFLKTLYLTDLDVLYTVPFIVNLGDRDTSLVTALYSVTPEGYGVFGNGIPVGAHITVGGSLDYHGIMNTVESALKGLFEVEGRIAGALMYSCVSRSIVLGDKMDDELAKAANIIAGRIPYQICYSGGEICPVKTAEGTQENYIHNHTFTVCAFEAGDLHTEGGG